MDKNTSPAARVMHTEATHGIYAIDTHNLTPVQTQALELVDSYASMGCHMTVDDAHGFFSGCQKNPPLAAAFGALINSGLVVADEDENLSVA